MLERVDILLLLTPSHRKLCDLARTLEEGGEKKRRSPYDWIMPNYDCKERPPSWSSIQLPSRKEEKEKNLHRGQQGNRERKEKGKEGPGGLAVYCHLSQKKEKEEGTELTVLTLSFFLFLLFPLLKLRGGAGRHSR